ncbi:hypothetical protein HYH03_004174 [Edaphochlamys debaryana]|uniref:Rab proteins geranylgeranyltransferase component A n=1 Tax=Edaphochlamys debaryana TaxID=47281 RepID=A0A835YA23_9CHLO|nr:hypothetical protein HYH03_004174 [Edaphochlamys debaryana]|eukprot:KAG2497909.1 hypothetical protein HYH03_004174 [Edaphochlamys debaryana]
MAWSISPDTYDVIVVGSGLPECLVAGSLVKSGKSVLIIDAVDTYGTDFASFTPAALAGAIRRQEGASEGAGEHEHSLPACESIADVALPSGAKLLPLQQRPLALEGIRALAVPGEGGGPADRRGYILDQVPKLVYQAEPLVDLLVRCRCHHYLEFKALEGGYILQDGALQPVPASRADIFRDRRLGLGDKRLLMRFIQGCVEARSGQGHLKEALSSSTPLAQVLRTEGLSPRLREVILYGIAMCRTDQESDGSADADAAAPTGLVSGTAGGAALELFTSSQGRFGQESAFMLPSYGCGSVAEAFVRLCAVHGAVTVLRQPVRALVLAGEGGSEATSSGAATGVDESKTVASVAAGEAATGTGRGAGGEGSEATVAEAAAGPRQGGAEGKGDEKAAAPPPPPEEPPAPGSCIGIVTASGQVVRCRTLVAGVGTLSCLEGVQPAEPWERISRAVAVLDGPLLHSASGAPATGGAGAAGTSSQAPAASGPPPSLISLVVPPRAAATGAGAGGSGAGAGAAGAGDGLGNPHPVQGLQMGATSYVSPAGRYLLYLSTPASPAPGSAHGDLRAALDALADTSGLAEPGTGAQAPAPATTTSTAATPSTTAPEATAEAAAESDGADKATAAGPAGAAGGGVSKPRALRAWFFTQRQLHGAAPLLAGRLPGGVVALPGPDGGLAGYGEVLRATEEACRAAFPEATWLAEVDFSRKAAEDGEEEEGAGGGGAAGGAGGGEDEEDDAIDDLAAVVASLSAAK